ncbi:multidrug effflux MFS transporter [Mycobacterium marinum]|uniref:multidrug effflux MFS transporter n=1 Tax=Mycobacterium marinum TaxID=1781 RepID=UPI0021C4732D|nr:multidrug effflux MFS transporter [Mycobacterium marinum]
MKASAPSRRIVAVLLCVVPLNQIPMDAYTPALPQMETSIGTTATALQSTVTVFMIGMALSYLAVGIMSDAWGRKPVLMGCAAALTVTSLACAAANNVAMLLVLRFLQGGACSAFIVVAIAIAADCFEGARLRSVNGLLGAAWSAAPILAPAVGGFIVEYASWRYVFVLIAALSVVVGLAVAWALPETLDQESRTRFELGRTWQVLTATARNRVFLALAAVFGLLAGPQLAFGVAAPFLYQDEMGFSPSAYGLIALVVGVAVLLGSFSTGMLATRMAFRRLAFADWTLYMVGAALLLGSAPVVGVNPWAITLAVSLAVAGCGALVPQAQAAALGAFSRNLGLVSGLFGTLTYLIIAAIMAIVGVSPERTQAPLGWLYVLCGALVFAALAWVTPRVQGEKPTPG